MFGAPVSRIIEGVNGYSLNATNPVSLKVRLELRNGELVPDVSAQPRIREFQDYILNELTKQTHVFKTAPKLEALQAITPNWGFVTVSDKLCLSSYTVIDHEVKESPSWVDLVFVGLLITRSTIRPVFKTLFLEASAGNVIDFGWDESEDLSEVADLEISPGATLKLKDPKALEKEKQQAKELVRNALKEVNRLRDIAQRQLDAYYAKYDVSDSESVFTDISTDDEDDS